MSKRRKDAEWVRGFETFFRSPLAEKAGSYLHDSVRIALHLEGFRSYLYERYGGRNRLRPAENPEADVHFFVPVITMRHLLDLGAQPTSGIGTMGVAVIEHLFHGEPARKIRFRVEISFLQLWRKGYFSVLKAGGPEVASYLAQWGYGNLARLKELLKRN